MSTTIPQLSQSLQKLLIEDADEIGRSSGFIKRQRKLVVFKITKAIAKTIFLD